MQWPPTILVSVQATIPFPPGHSLALNGWAIRDCSSRKRASDRRSYKSGLVHAESGRIIMMTDICKAVNPAMLLLLTSFLSANSAVNTVTIGSVEVPANCGLARGEHPRLLFTRADQSYLRAQGSDFLRNIRVGP
jgi:hypothetical protein